MDIFTEVIENKNKIRTQLKQNVSNWKQRASKNFDLLAGALCDKLNLPDWHNNNTKRTIDEI